MCTDHKNGFPYLRLNCTYCIRYGNLYDTMKTRSWRNNASNLTTSAPPLNLSHWLTRAIGNNTEQLKMSERFGQTPLVCLHTHTQTWSADAMMTSRALILVSIDFSLCEALLPSTTCLMREGFTTAHRKSETQDFRMLKWLTEALN